jgi:hypothetical protein
VLRRTSTVFNLHSQKTDTYEGGLLEEILRKTGTLNSEHLREPVMEFYVIAESADGNRVVFSLAELDSGIIGSNILVADTMDGAPLSEREGLFKIVVSHEITSSALDSHAAIQHRRSCARAVPSPFIRIRRDSL